MRMLDQFFNLNTAVKAVYLHRFLFNLGLSSVSVFLPLYIYTISSSVFAVLLFFGLYYGLRIFLSMYAARFASKIGYKRSAIYASPFVLVFYWLLRNTSQYSWTLYAIAVLGSIAFTFYWTGVNAEMAAASDRENRGEQTGFFISTSILASIISPFLGGLVIYVFDYSMFFLIVILVMATSFIPFLLTRENFAGMYDESRDLFSTKYLNDFLTYVSRGITNIGRKALWPLYLGIVITGELNIGGSGSLMSLGGAVASLTIGSFLTEKTKKPILYIGGGLFALSTIAMGFAATPLQAFIVSFVNGLLIHSVNLPIYSGALSAAEEKDILRYFAFREIGLCLGRVLVLSLIAVFFASFSQYTAFILGFTVIAAGVVGSVRYGTRIQY